MTKFKKIIVPSLALALLLLSSCSKDTEAFRAFVKADQALRNGQEENAIGYLREAVRINDDFGEAHYNLAELLYKQGKYSDAVPSFNKAASLLEGNFSAQYFLGNALSRVGRFDEAITAYQRAIKIRPDSSLSYFNLASAYASKGKLDNAVEQYQKVLSINANDAEAHYSLASIQGQRRNFDAALSGFAKAIALRPDFAEAYYYLGVTYYNMGDKEKAKGAMSNAVNLRPNYVPALNDLGVMYMKMGDSATGLNYLGLSQAHNGQLKEAVLSFKRSSRANPKSVEGLFNAGLVLARIEQQAAAINELEKALLIKPDMPEVLINLRMMYTKMGNTSRAQELQRRIDALNLSASQAVRSSDFQL